ncbi:MAG: methyltransferase domain-containing protein [Methanobacteriaceae archaeon]|nr:methyltransferase domain-containing protein [Methanobacteriaceae archaeon]
MKIWRKCPICGSDDLELLHNQKFANLSESSIVDNYNIVSCNYCGFVYANTKSSQQDYDSYYESMSKYQDSNASGSGSGYYDEQRLIESAETILKYVPKDYSILDVGCATGGLLYELKKRGFKNLEGLDPSPVCARLTNEKGIKSSTGSIFENNLNKKYDCIILTHVLEHLRDLKRGIDLCKDLLTENGIIYIESPNAKLYKESYIVPYYYFDCEHINHLDINSIKNLMLDFDCVYTCEKLQQFTKEINYPVFKAVFSKSNSKSSIKKDESAKNSVLNFINDSKNDVANKLINDIDINEPLIIWGAGQYALRLLANTDLNKYNIIAFIDNNTNKQDTVIENIPVKNKDILYDFEGTILIASALFSDEILEDITNMGIENSVIIL